jgi:phosphatidylglycerophosphatase C
MALVVFDLDGTITRHDSLLRYLIGFLRLHPARWPRILLWPPAMVRFGVGLADRGALKAALMRATLGGCTRSTLDTWTQRYLTELFAGGMRADALAAIARHQSKRDVLVLMSASPDLYVPEIARRLGFTEAICTGVRWQGERFDGTLTTPNRHGAEKALCFAELRQRYPGLATVAYADSASDFDHLELADEAWIVNPSPALLREAQRKHFHLAIWR